MACINELYSKEVISKEIPVVLYGKTLSGRENVPTKNKQSFESIEEFHSNEISEPIIAGNYFTATMKFDLTFKDRGRQQMKETCVFEVKNGKTNSEQFFYTM